MSLDRKHPVFTGDRRRDVTPPRYLSRWWSQPPRSRCSARFLDDEMVSRSCRWRYRRYICMVGAQNSGRRSLAKRFFEREGGNLSTNGNYWLRGQLSLKSIRSHLGEELDLLIRIVPAPHEELNWDYLVATGTHCSAALVIFTIVCARVRDLTNFDALHGLFFMYLRDEALMRENLNLVVGTKSDLRVSGRFWSEERIHDEVAIIFAENGQPTPPYRECSVLTGVNVNDVITEALLMIIA